MTGREAFLAGDRPDDVAIYIAEEAVSGAEALADRAEVVGGGYVLVLPGEAGRSAFSRATGTDAMAFARRAMGTDGEIEPDLTGGECPAGEEGDHRVRFVLAFAEEQSEAAGGIYAEGDVVHAYAMCSCGTAFSDRWVV